MIKEPTTKPSTFSVKFITYFFFLFSVKFTLAQTTQIFTYTNTAQSFTVPSCVNTLTVSMAGAQGGDGIVSSVGPGGGGGSLTAVISVSPGQVLSLNVGGVGGNASTTAGGTGGYNGGGAGSYYNSTYSGGGGGGASDIRMSPFTLADRIAVAGGGGGGSKYSSISGYERGGNGGGNTGEAGYFINANNSGQGGYGGTASAGGSGGANITFCTAYSGSLGLGGGSNACNNGGGGGGGGYYGGGGGVFAGGGGGSNYVVAGSLNVLSSQGSNTGNGVIVLTYRQILYAPIISSATSNTLCSGTTINLSISPSFAATSYSWSNGANTPTLTDSPTSGTIYTLTATDGTCNIISSLTITTVPSVPSLTVVNSATNAAGVCPGKPATLTANGAVTYTWAGLNSVSNGVSFIPTVASDYTVTGENACGTSSAITSVSIHPNPIVGISALTGSICSGNTTTISVTGNSSSYTISTAVSAPVVVNNLGFQPAVSNTYIVVGASALGCTVTANTSVQVVQTPTLAPTSSTVILCIGKSATLSATGATGGYTWTTGSTTLSTSGSTIQVTPNTTTTYSVTKNSSTCFDTKAITIQVNSLTPIFVAASSTLVCASKPTTLTAFGGIGFEWYSSAAPTASFSSSISPVVSPPTTTDYTVAASDGTCINTAAITISTNPNPTINIATTSTNICIGSAVSLTASGGQGVNYTWTSVPATSTITGQDVISPAFPTTGAYAFSATGDNQYNCSSTSVKVVLVNPQPTLTASANRTLICSGGSTTLNVAGASIYKWDANANNANTATTVVNPLSTIVYVVSGTLSSTQCSASANATVNIYTPTVSITNPTNTCFGAAYTLTGSVNNPAGGVLNSYTWNVPGNPNSNGPSVLVTPTVLTVYTLSAKSTTMGTVTCVESKTTSLGIFYNPTLTVSPTRSYVCRNETVGLTAYGADTYTWNGGAYTGSLITVSHNTVGTVGYTVAGIDANGCRNDTVFYLKINGCQGLEELGQSYSSINLYPNPNNGYFYIITEQPLRLTLVNELGQVVREFETNAYNEYKIQIDGLTKGIYFITGSDNQAVTRQKIIVK
ncbi:MAG: T9SS type A sorting domain-containing protein [Bacteroidia bacterium]|nr:T9SS type A sorting domain-containing protein [Bacteroidia bacterium]